MFHKVVQTHYLGEVKTFIMVYSKYIQNNKYKIVSESAWFCRRCDENIWCVLGSQFQLLFTTKTRTLSFTRQCSDIIQVSWKTFKVLYRKFIQDNVYQILRESTGFCRRCDKNILVCFLSVHSVSKKKRRYTSIRILLVKTGS